VRYCKDNDLKVLDLRDILLLLARRKALSWEEMKDLIREIEQKDNIIIKDKSSILNKFER